MKNKIILIFMLAFLIRLISLNQSLWLDEATTANVVKNFGFVEIITKFSPHDFHPPLYYLFLKLWTNIFGYSEIALRMPSLLFSLLTGWFVYLIGRKLKNERVGVGATILFLFNPLIVYYSQEARMYMMATFLLTAALYYFIKLLRVNELTRLNLFFFYIFISLSFLTFYGSIFFILPMLFYLFSKKRYREFLVSCFVLCVALLLISPLLWQQLLNAKESLFNLANWTNLLGKPNLKNLLLIPVKFSVGRISFEPKILYWGVSGIWVVWLFCNFILAGLKNKFLLYLFIFPLVIGFFVSFFTPLLSYFRFLYLIPILCLILSFALKGEFLKILTILGFIFFSLVYILMPAFHREDWKSLAKDINSKKIYMITASSDPLNYYRSGVMVEELRNIAKTDDKRLLVIPYTAEIYRFDYKKILEQKGYLMTERKNFRGVYYEIWERKIKLEASRIHGPQPGSG